MKLKFSFDDVWGRVQIATGFKKQKQLADLLGISTGAIASIKKKDGFLLHWAHAIADEYSLNVDWLLYGKGPMKRVEGPSVNESYAPYPVDHAASLQPPAIKKDQTSVKQPETGIDPFLEDVGHLKKIYDYNDPDIINAIHCNLKTFAGTVDSKMAVNQQKKKIVDLEASIKEKYIIDNVVKKLDEISTKLDETAAKTERLDAIESQLNKRKRGNGT